MSEPLTCQACGRTFELRDELAQRYPGWQPRECPTCYRAAQRTGSGGSSSSGDSSRRTSTKAPSATHEDNRTLADILLTYDAGPDTGVFTDGSANPNPGPGGWGAVYVVDGDVRAQDYGHDPDTTNNRMELVAVIHGIDLVPRGTAAVIYSDSRLVVDTLTKWAAGWKRRGWRRKTGPVENLDLVEGAYEALQRRPELELRWIKAHSGNRWNEYADALSTAYARSEL